MRTSQEMLDFARIDQDKSISVFDKTKVNVFKLAFDEVEKTLQANEDVLYTFVATSVQRKDSSILFYCGVAVTNKRIIIGGQIKGLIKVSYTAQSLSTANVNSVNESYSALGAYLVIETLGDDLKFALTTREAVGIIKNKLWDVLDNNKQDNNGGNTTVVNQLSPAEELKKFKELLDMGIISQEEFDAKKKQLLGF